MKEKKEHEEVKERLGEIIGMTLRLEDELNNVVVKMRN